MAMYIKLVIGDEDVANFGVSRLENLTKKRKIYTYHATKYILLKNGIWQHSHNIKEIKHRYSDKAEILAEKVLHAFNTETS